MPATDLPSDPLWPRAAHWIVPAAGGSAPGRCDLGLLGVPAHATSITPTGAHATPAAIRQALLRYSTYAGSRGVDVSVLSAVDFGDVSDPDGPEGELRLLAAAAEAANRCELLIALGGDNSITFAAASGVLGGGAARDGAAGAGDVGPAAGPLPGGLVTLDAHHDLRDGASNGSPVRRLVEAGLAGTRIAQVGIADFSNSAAYAKRAREMRITAIGRDEARRRGIAQVMSQALQIAGADGGPVYVDIDVDVCDRSVVPGCPSAAPGGLSADELRQAAFLAGLDPRVRAIDITEIDAERDADDERTVRLAALLVLEAAAGLALRLGRA
jgi:formiminoglutamase